MEFEKSVKTIGKYFEMYCVDGVFFIFTHFKIFLDSQKEQSVINFANLINKLEKDYQKSSKMTKKQYIYYRLEKKNVKKLSGKQLIQSCY